MLSSPRTMLTTLFACSMLSGCSSDLMAPGVPEGASASVTKVGAAALGPVSVSVSDSTLVIGDTVRLAVNARNTRTFREVTREVKWVFSSSDTVVATVNHRGLVTARGKGFAKISARTALGTATLSVAVDVGAVSALNPVGIASAPAAGALSPVDLGNAPPFTAPMLPAATVNVDVPRVTGRSIRVAAGDNAALQAALNAAVGGDEVVLPANGEFVGNFILPKHSGTSAVTVRGEGLTTALGVRLTPATAASLPRVITNSVDAAFQTADGASNWHLIGLSVSLRAGTIDNYGIVRLGSGAETALAQLPNDIVLDRVMISGGETGNTSRCVGFNGNALAVVNSWLADCHAKGRDAQGIGGWTGLGPFLIENNHIEGSGQNIMFGGADPRIANVTPSDITIRGNHLFKPMSWAGGRWTVKAAFELKHARRVLFEGNVIENHWADAQVGFAILMQTVNQDGTAPWSKIQDVTVRNNVIKNSTSGLNLLSRMRINGVVPDEPAKRILVRNNLFLNVGKDPVSGTAGRFLQLMSDHQDVTVMQNTWIGAHANNALMFDGEPGLRTMLFNNLFGDSEYGVMGSGFGEGAASFTQFAPGAMVEGNAFVGRMERLYPARNSFPATIDNSVFVNAAGGDYTLRATVAYSASGSTIVGVNGLALSNAIANTVSR